MALPYEAAVFGLERFRTQATTFYDFLHSDTSEATVAQISVKENQFAKLQSELFFWRQNVIVACSMHSNRDQEIVRVDLILSACDTLLSECLEIILLAKQDLLASNQQVPSHSNHDCVESEFNVEKTKPPTFSGDYTEWHSFADLFTAAIASNPRMSGAVKLAHLKKSLTGGVASMVANIPTKNENFVVAWDLVEKRFNKKREIVFSHLHKLFSLSPVPDSSKGILSMVDTINQCLRSLKVYKVKVEDWDIFIVYWAHLTLDPETRKEWLLQTDSELPVLSDFLSFLEKRADALIPREFSKSKSEREDKSASHHASSPKCGKAKPNCSFCGENHRIYSCKDFLELSPQERSAFATRKKLCKNCLHQHEDPCKSTKTCGECQKPHHTLLRFRRRLAITQGTTTPQTKPGESGSRSAQVTISGVSGPEETVGSHHISSPQNDNVPLMGTLILDVIDSQGQFQKCRVFVDTGSEVNFVSESFVNRLNLRRNKSDAEIIGVSGTVCGVARGQATFSIDSRFHNFGLSVKALILPKITGNLPRLPCQGNFEHLRGIQISDEKFNIPSKIDILLGTVDTAQILLPGLRVGPKGTPTAINSKFGWFLTGSAPPSNPVSTFNICVKPSDEKCLEKSLGRFWDLEEPKVSSLPFSDSEESCERHFLRTFSRNSDSRFEVELPFLNAGELGESKLKAISCFKSLERQLGRDLDLKVAYHAQMEDYISKGWVEIIPRNELSPLKKVSVATINGENLSLSPYYLPHHVVRKPGSTTTKFRVVFNASANSTSGLSLNSILHTGPKIQTDLHPLLIRFRSHIIALSADMVQFYNQVEVNKTHSDFQRLVWKKYPSDDFVHLRFLRVTFGVGPSAFLAIRVLRELGENCKPSFPLAAKSIENDFLVDNLISGASTVEKAMELKSQLVEVLSQGKFPLQKWVSNDPTVLESLSPEERETFSMDVKVGDSIKTIGLYWHPATDTFGVRISDQPQFLSATEREILSHVSRIFDPLQWLAPITITAKMLLQSLWREKVGWDESISEVYLKKWQKYSSSLKLLREFRIPRCLTFTTFSESEDVRHELIGFCDASTKAYGACVYLRSRSEGKVKVQLIAAKSKVAPVNGETTPRLELCSAVLLSQLVNTTAVALSSTEIRLSPCLCFTDSTGALGQLFSTEKQPLFVANRVRRIKSSKIFIHWYYVPGDQNPADQISRGLSPKLFISNRLWLSGPDFLRTEELPPQP